ncbi:MAG TPA: hypothetical protein VF829_00330 [Candidatus Paceibacterota bacterium]
MNNEEKSVYYWASWKRAWMFACFFGVVATVGFYLDGMRSFTDTLRGLALAACLVVFLSLLLGTTFIRIKNSRVYYTSSLFEWRSMDMPDIKAITLIPRFSFTDKVTAVQIEKKNPGVFPGFLLSRDAFPDAAIAAIVSHLKRLNPTIELDEGVQKILQSQENGRTGE